MTVIMIRRGKNVEENGIWDYLQGVFDSDIKTMKKYSDVSWSSKLEQEVYHMCGLGESIYQKGTQEGRREGRKEGRREMIVNMLSAGKTPEEIALFANIPIEEVKDAESTILLKSACRKCHMNQKDTKSPGGIRFRRGCYFTFT